MKSPHPKADLAQDGQIETATVGTSPRLRIRALGQIPRPLIGAVVAVLVVLVAVFSGTVEGSDRTLVVMGFDPDRAQLITALVFAAVAAVAATLAIDRPAIGALLGTWTVVALFGETFIAETHSALAATGALGSFDLIGWIVTLVTLVVVGFISAWAGATLAAAIRPSLVATGASVREMVEARRPNRQAASRPVAAALILGLLAVTVPSFGDMVNLAPDALMLDGGHFVALAPDNSIPPESTTPAETPTSSAVPSSQPETPSPSASPTGHAKPGTKPWLAWKPKGTGQVTTVSFDAPWKGGVADKVDVKIYTPPEYSEGNRRYPVLYEAPTGLSLWDKGTAVITTLDGLIDSGAMPASLVVFIDSSGATYPDTQCADSYDGKMWLETFIWNDAVKYVDAHYRTIGEPIARGVMGMSAGGFCAAMLVSRHPDVFGTSISFSGYFYAGAGSASARYPYGGIQAKMDAVSPALLVPHLSAAEKASVYFIVIAAPTQDLYGPQAQNFEKILAANRIAYDAVKSIWVHSWTQVRNDFPTAMAAWAARMVVDGVW